MRKLCNRTVDSKKYLTKIKIAKTKKDIYLYNSTRFKKVNRVMMFKKGTYFKIVKIVPVGKTTRLLTQSGYYIAGNKSFIKAYR
ncbi:DUF5776 domain-containing protein [Periweissella fabalis]|uniref:DUF5776 domain-containing protein n=1 Tax=Periweissella fabalis TaxID=1070421 RepID=UPI003B8484DA